MISSYSGNIHLSDLHDDHLPNLKTNEICQAHLKDWRSLSACTRNVPVWEVLYLFPISYLFYKSFEEFDALKVLLQSILNAKTSQTIKLQLENTSVIFA